MDITETIAPKSDQLNAEDLLTGPRTFTVEKVTKGSVEQPVEIHLVGMPGRPFKPSKTVRRILVAAWGAEASAYVGRRMRLFRDASVRFGGMDVGGIRVSHLSDIPAKVQVALTVTRGRRAPFIVEPLPDVPPEIVEFEKRIDGAGSLSDLDAVARDLKAADLGEHRNRLLAAWSARRDALSQAVDEAPAESIPATKEQLAQLDSIRQMEKYDENEWMAFLRDTAGISVDKLADLTSAQAATVIGMFQGDGQPA